MPELPEVEVVRRGLDRWVTGRTIDDVTVGHPRAIRRHAAGPEDFTGRLAGRKITAVRRRGKYLWLTTDGDESLLAHLGMSGQLLVGAPDRPSERHLRVRFTFADGGHDLRFVDQRTFGHLMVGAMVPDAFARPAPSPPSDASAGTAPADQATTMVPRVIAHIAPDPLEPAFDQERFRLALRARRTGVKRALLDQSLISGVGNIYADEALWRARLHWARPTAALTRAQVAALLTAVREVMEAALAAGGTSFDSLYVNVDGESGYFDRVLEAYGRRDLPCSRCGTPIRRDVFMNRSSFSCPTCQPRPRGAVR